MTKPDSFPEVVGSSHSEEKRAILARAVGKTIASVEYGSVDLSPDKPRSEAAIIHFADGSSVALVASLNDGGVTDGRSVEVGDVKVDLTVIWGGGNEWGAFDEVIGL